VPESQLPFEVLAHLLSVIGIEPHEYVQGSRYNCAIVHKEDFIQAMRREGVTVHIETREERDRRYKGLQVNVLGVTVNVPSRLALVEYRPSTHGPD